MKKVVVLGAGYAGILTAKKLAKKLKKHKDVEISIIDKNPFHTMLTELHEVAAWRVEEDSIKIDLKRVFAGRNVKVVLDKISTVDYDKKVVKGEAGTYNYDYLVLATGSKPTFFGIQGAAENAFTLWSYDDAVKLREHIITMFRKAACETDQRKKRELLTFYVVGAGFTGVEMAGELAELAPIFCERFAIDPSDVTIVNVDALDRAVPVLPEKLSRKVIKRLEKMHCTVKLKTKITGVGSDYIECQTDGKTTKSTTHTVIWTAGIEGSEIAMSSPNLGTSKRGRIQTDEFLRSEKDKSVYIGGDNIFYIPEGSKDPVPAMVENCEASSGTIAHNIACAITGQGEMEKYKPSFHGVMVCIGGRYGVAHVGAGKHFFGLASFFAMFSKHFINLIYFLQVLGWNKIFSYISHEFFTIRNKRSFVGGHFSNRSPSFLLAPLRVFLGIIWVYEGIKKIGEGWLGSAKLASFFSGADGYYNGLLNSLGHNPLTQAAADAASSATDAATAATGAAAEVATSASQVVDGAAQAAGKIFFDWDIFGILRLLWISSGDVAFKVQFALMDWFNSTFLMPNEGVQMFFQVFIVVSEILIGLALIGGLFTTLASGYSLILECLFLMTTGLYLDTCWMVFAAVAMLFGGGRALSLDYYVIPFLKKHWKNVKFVRKWYLYHD